MPRKLYWQNSSDFHNAAISNTMSRNRFKNILSVLHLSDNMDLDKQDKITKIRPFYYKIVKSCIENRPNSSDHSADESMLSYYGRSNSKQLMEINLVQSRYNIWVLAELLGYVVYTDPYQGAKNGMSTRTSEQTLGLGVTVVLSLLDTLPKETCYRVFMDNVFRSFRLLEFLAANNIRGSGTMRENRLGDCTISKKKAIDKFEHEAMNYRTSAQHNLTVVAWKDNKTVYVASNRDAVEPLPQVQQRKKQKQAKVAISQLFLINQYNKGMEGVDQADQNIATYWIAVKAKKWWWAFFACIQDMILQYV